FIKSPVLCCGEDITFNQVAKFTVPLQFDRQIVIPAVAFSGAKHEREHTDIYSSCRLIVKKNGAEIYNRTALDNTLIYSGVIDMPAGHGHMTLEFSVSAWLVNDWYPTASISDLLVVVMKKATAGISIS
ncbi:phage tail tip protein, partial [Escherichia coli]|uniref:phage tail tip domain-containing protein n=1 Tax=Escherichia coli TaxID=562 RepID=UPI003CE46FB4